MARRTRDRTAWISWQLAKGLPVFWAAACLVCGLAALGLAERARAQGEIGPSVIQIAAPDAWGAGALGEGVLVGVLDTGVLPEHLEFAGRILPGVNTVGGSSTQDGDGHGTHVAGIIGAAADGRGMVGVAPLAQLVPIKALTDEGRGSQQSIAQGLRYAASQGLAVVNMSIGTGSAVPGVEAALREATVAGVLPVIAAGNSGDPTPEYPAYYAARGVGPIVVVGSVDPRNRISEFSNRAGDAMRWFVVAPGERVQSTYAEPGPRCSRWFCSGSGPTASYAALSGTSMAVPHVSGVAALLKSRWPQLSNRDLAQIIFRSATDLGAPGIDEVYGHGLVNAARAAQPLGELQMPSAAGLSFALSETGIQTSVAVGAALSRASREGQLQVVGFDDFQRDFTRDLGDRVEVSPADGGGLARMVAAVEAEAQRTQSGWGGTLQMTMLSSATRRLRGDARAWEGEQGGAFAVTRRSLRGREVFFGASGMAGHAFGLAGELSRRPGHAALGALIPNPYFSLVPEHLHAGVGFAVAPGVQLRAGAVVSDPGAERVLGAQSVARADDTRRQQMTVVELSGGLRELAWTLGLAQLRERDSVLGAVQRGGLAFGGVVRTRVASVGVAYSPTPALSVGAQYQRARSRGAGNRERSFVTGYSEGSSDAWSLFAALRDVLSEGDRLSLTLSQPMRMRSGSMNAVLPAAAARTRVGGAAADAAPDANGAEPAPVGVSARLAARSISLEPGSRELRGDLLYLTPIDERTVVFFGGAVRRHPDHDRERGLDVSVGVGLRMQF